MFLIKTNNDFYSNKLFDLFRQTNLNITLNQNDRCYSIISIEIFNTKIRLTNNDNNIILHLPLRFDEIFNQIKILLKDFKIFFDSEKIIYHPIHYRVYFNNLVVELGIIHNIIFSNLILNQKNGILKTSLYSLIWPDDKNLQINKLDTHLTNLKNKFKENLSYDLKIKSMKGLLFLRSN